MPQSMTSQVQSVLVEQAGAIVLILESELGVRVTLYDAESGDEIRTASGDSAIWRASELAPEFIRSQSLRERPAVLEVDDQSYRAILPLREGGLTRVIAVADLPRFTRDERERHRMEKWCVLLLDKLVTSFQRSRRQGDSRQRDQALSLVGAMDVLVPRAGEILILSTPKKK